MENITDSLHGLVNIGRNDDHNCICDYRQMTYLTLRFPISYISLYNKIFPKGNFLID